MASDTDRHIRPAGQPWLQDNSLLILENGLRVLFARREGSPIVEFRLVVEGGFASDPERRTGLAALAVAMFGQGYAIAGGTQLGSGFDAIGAVTMGQVLPDAALFGLSALNTTFDDALAIYANALTNLEFETSDFDLLRASRLALIAAERLDPFQLALRVLPPMLYGDSHLYSRPFTGSGTEKDVADITCDDLRGYYTRYLTPDTSTLIIVGSGEAHALHTKLEQTFGQWQVASAAPTPTLSWPDSGGAVPVVIVNQPGAPQAVIATGLRTFPRNSSRAEPLMVLDAILGGIFASRLNLKLREQKGWTYGVHSALLDARLEGLWLIRTAVRSNCAVQAMLEIAEELEALTGRKPPTPDEFCRAVNYLVTRIPATLETCAQMADALAHLVVHRLPVSYLQNLPMCLRHLTPEDVTETCQKLLAGAGPRWMLLGDSARLTEELRLAGFREIKIIELNEQDVA